MKRCRRPAAWTESFANCSVGAVPDRSAVHGETIDLLEGDDLQRLGIVVGGEAESLTKREQGSLASQDEGFRPLPPNESARFTCARSSTSDRGGWYGQAFSDYVDRSVLAGPPGSELPIRWIDGTGTARWEVLPGSGLSDDDAVWPSDLQRNDFFRRRGTKVDSVPPPDGPMLGICQS
jgi:hypothetical protein